MTGSVKFWKLLMLGAVVLWLFSILLGLLFFEEYGIRAWALFIVLIVIHVSEIPLCVKLGRERGVLSATAVFKALLFGFTWWVPLKRGIIDG